MLSSSRFWEEVPAEACAALLAAVPSEYRKASSMAFRSMSDTFRRRRHSSIATNAWSVKQRTCLVSKTHAWSAKKLAGLVKNRVPRSGPSDPILRLRMYERRYLPPRACLLSISRQTWLLGRQGGPYETAMWLKTGSNAGLAMEPVPQIGVPG